jgi:hypothetical protein
MKTKPWRQAVRTLFILPAAVLIGGCDVDCLVDHLDCIHGDCGASVTQELDWTGFDEIACDDAFQISIRQGRNFHISVTYPDDFDVDEVIHRRGDRVEIGFDGCPCGGGRRRAVIELPRLRRLAADGACRVELEGVDSSDLTTLDVSGASRVDGDFTSGEARIRLSGASHTQLRGTATEIDLALSGASRAQLVDLITQRADVQLDGASVASVNVREQLDVAASGASRLEYRGDPHIGRLDLEGGSKIEHVD